MYNGATGLIMSNIDYAARQVPFSVGSLVENTIYRERDIVLPLLVRGTNVAERQAALDDFIAHLEPEIGECTLIATGESGGVRVIGCRFTGGLDGEIAALWTYNQNIYPQFRAFSPLWQDQTITSLTFPLPTYQTFFPFPFSLSSSELRAEATIDNDGHFYVWPTLRLNGPASSISFTNLSTNQTMDFSASGLTLAAGESMTITATDFSVIIERSNGQNLFPYMSAESNVWFLRKGLNQIRMSAIGVGPSSLFSVDYRRRWWNSGL